MSRRRLRSFGLPLAVMVAFAVTIPGTAVASFGTLSYSVHGPAGLIANNESGRPAGCPAGTYVLGGGQYVLAASRDAIVHTSAPSGDHRWLSQIDSFNGAHNTATEYAICSTRKPIYRSKTVTLHGPAQPKLRTSCPAGTAALGGGVDIRAQYNSAYITVSDPGPGASWDAHAVAGLRMPNQKVTDWVICAPANVVYRSVSGTVAPNDFGEAFASCPAGTHVVAGGVRVPDFAMSQFDVDVRPTISSPFDGPDADSVPDDGWQVEADDWGAGGDLMIQATAVCIR